MATGARCIETSCGFVPLSSIRSKSSQHIGHLGDLLLVRRTILRGCRLIPGEPEAQSGRLTHWILRKGIDIRLPLCYSESHSGRCGARSFAGSSSRGLAKDPGRAEKVPGIIGSLLGGGRVSCRRSMTLFVPRSGFQSSYQTWGGRSGRGARNATCPSGSRSTRIGKNMHW
jgi:hypothetical protein